MLPTFSLIGCGRIGERHAALMHEFGTLLAVCDTDREKANRLATLYNAQACYDQQDLFAHNVMPDFTAVCTPNGLHAEQSMLALEHGSHVLCEKPMAIRADDCMKMVQTADDSGKQLFIVKQNRFNPPVQLLKKLLMEQRLGKIYSFEMNCFWNREPSYYEHSWRGSKKLDGGTLFTQFSHFIDLLYWLFGELKASDAVLGNYAHQGVIEFEDSGMAMLEFDNAVMGTLNYNVNSHGKNMEGSVTVFGEKGTIKIGGAYLNKVAYVHISDYTPEPLEQEGVANHYGNYQGSMSNHRKVYDNLIRFFNEEEAVNISARDGMKSVEMIEKIYANARWIK